jgi:nucleotide-binding universal stress UspA family protein
MTAQAIPTRTPPSAGAAELRLTRAMPANRTTPIVAAVDGSSASRSAIEIAVKLAVELNAPLVFVYVRRGPPGFLGRPFFQRRLTAKMTRARRAVDRALSAAAHAGVDAEGEILEGAPRKRILQLASDRDARLIVVGSRRRRFSRSVSCGVLPAAEGPVVVARSRRPLLSDVR